MTEQSITLSHANGVVTGVPRTLLRLEGALVLAAATYAYSQTPSSWLFFALLFFAPDIFMLGYLKDSRVGSIGYNVVHTYLIPAAVFLGGWYFGLPILIAMSFTWLGHIGFDRAVGYGLKYAAGFKSSHLGSPFLAA